MKTREPSSKAPAGLGSWTASAPALAEKFAAGKPFKHLVVDDFLDAAFARELLESFPPYDDARFRNEHGDRGKAFREDVRALGPAYERLDDILSSQEFLDLMSRLTGIEGLMHDPYYLGGGTHENGDDMELDPHVDFTIHPNTRLHRRVNLLLYLNPDWDKSWGGNLELHTDPWGEAKPTETIVPVFNRCALFETHAHSWHGVDTLKLPDGLSRRSFALYLYTREPAPGARPIPSDLTVFVPRPIGHLYGEGMKLTLPQVRLLQRGLARRDWLLRHLYDRSLELSKRLIDVEAQLVGLTAALSRQKDGNRS